MKKIIIENYLDTIKQAQCDNISDTTETNIAIDDYY